MRRSAKLALKRRLPRSRKPRLGGQTARWAAVAIARARKSAAK